VTLLSSADERDEAEWLANEVPPAASGADGDVAYEEWRSVRTTRSPVRRRGVSIRAFLPVDRRDSFYERREVKTSSATCG